MLICNIVGARPNFIKMAPIVQELNRRNIRQMLVHTGQHYDRNMSQVFFEQLKMPEPDIYMGVGSDTHARQTAKIMVGLEEICQNNKPDLVLVAGDVNSTVAAALVAAKLHIPVGHVEAGLRSFDRTMPEEINRIVTDHVSDLLFTTEENANQNLAQEGIGTEFIHFVGNCMVDTLRTHVEAAVAHAPWSDFELASDRYALLTLHRPSNVDEQEALGEIMETINQVSRHMPVLFPIHPRTRQRVLQWQIELSPSVHLCDPLPYLTFLGLMARARCVLTDSGGVQEETTALGIPCLTLRWNTERPITVTTGTNQLVGTDREQILKSVGEILDNRWKQGKCPPLWDGRASQRIVNVVEAACEQK